MLPGMGGFEAVVIALLALVIVGPKDLPVLMRKLARWVNKVRGMAAEFRMSFDELARQSELDELRREVDALRRGEPLAPIRNEIQDFNKSFDEQHRAYETAVAEANGDAAPPAEEPYLPSLEPQVSIEARPEGEPPAAEAQSEAPAAEPAPKPKRSRRKAESAPAAGGEA